MSIQGAASTSCTHWKYDVFISFRGEDTRTNFTDHLHVALAQKGIFVFKDDKELRKGKSIAPELSKAIKESRISIVVISKNYASSTWCLDELVQITQCMRKNKQIVIPIFYDVDPSIVRKQKKNFRDAFVGHEKKNKEKVQIWRNALKKVANISGFDLKGSSETKVIQNVVKVIQELIPKKFNINEDLVGVSSRSEKLITLLTSTTEFDDVLMIGIYGMGGIGKTTIARVVCDLISHEFAHEFDGVSFLENVREISKGVNGWVHLQQQLLSQILGETYTVSDVGSGTSTIKRIMKKKKILVVIDDVDNIDQLSFLVGNHDWFGLGSRIIITTRDKHLLMAHGVDKLYQAEELNCDEALELFSLRAFKIRQPPKEYLELCREVVNYAGGLPLALTVLGSFLFGRSIDEWESALDRLRRNSESKISDCLQISFDGLQETEKNIFLDIACFFKGKNKEYVTRILDSCGFSPTIGIRVLVDKCLLTISIHNELWMHDLLQEMGQQIVKKAYPKDPEKRSRLWEKTDVLHMLANNMGTKEVEGIIIENEEQMSGMEVVGGQRLKNKAHVLISAKAFSKMPNLRLLKIHGVQLFEGLEYLSQKLSLLDWHGYSLKSLPSSLQLVKTVILELQYSHIEELWKKTRPSNKLQVINLSHSKKLRKTPDFSEIPNLEELNLEGCTKLCEVHPSLLVHKRVRVLNMKDCTSLTTLPIEIDMESLEEFVLSGCLRLKKFPRIVRSLKRLSKLFLDRTPIKELPFPLERLTELVLLSLAGCKDLVTLPNDMKILKFLEILNLSGCSKLKKVVENVGQIESLEELNIRGTASDPQEFNSFSSLCSLTYLNLSFCNLEVAPRDIGSLASLRTLNLGGNRFVSLPASMNALSNLLELDLDGCFSLQSVPQLSSSVRYIGFSWCVSLKNLPSTLKSRPFTLIRCENCFSLEDYDGTTSVLSSVKAGPPEWDRTDILLPGSKIPDWFICQSEGSSIALKRRADLTMKGFALCAVVFIPPGIREFRVPVLHCRINGVVYCGHEFGATWQGMPDHLWFRYIRWGEARVESEDWYSYEIKIEAWHGDPGMEVRRCGVRPIFEEEDYEIDQGCNSVFADLIEFHPPDSVAPEMEGPTTDPSIPAGTEASETCWSFCGVLRELFARFF